MNYKAFVDHTLLRSDASLSEISKLCQEVLDHGFHSVCVSPFYVKYCAKYLQESPAKVATVIGYPMGYSCLNAKVEEISTALLDGTDELDVVLNINAIKSADWAFVKNEIETLVNLVHLHKKVIKLIIEYELCTTEERIKTLQLCNEAAPDFVKTSTGNNHTVVTEMDIQWVRSTLNNPIEIKASGGIRTLEQIKSLVDAGATRIGTSSATKIFS